MSGTAAGHQLLDLELHAEVWLADEQIELKRLLALEPGRTISLARDPEDPVDLVVNGSVVASGELVVVDGRFGFRVTTTTQGTLAELERGENPGDPAEDPVDDVTDGDGGAS